MANISHVEIRMYRMGTGDCFVLKFFEKKNVVLKIMIDAGTWQGSATHLEPYMLDLMSYVDNKVDVLIVTHEHKDHVHVFNACKQLFTEEFEATEIWLGWTENDSLKKVKQWKDDYGEKKFALSLAASQLENIVASDDYKKQFEGSRNAINMLGARQHFSATVSLLTELHMDKDNMGVYKGGLAGMEIVKKQIKGTKRYFRPGDVIGDIIEGLNFYVLGPPVKIDDVDIESGGEGESYEHNKVLKENGTFAAAALNLDRNELISNDILPFDTHYSQNDTVRDNDEGKQDTEKIKAIKEIYESADWRKIDHEWLHAAGDFALRMESLTNNLSLAIAIEFKDSGKVMLFPGDAEYGSWASWHNIKWKEDTREDKEKHLTEDLLNRTIFYKVAHHMSHNGTARRLGLEMMTHKDLVAMGTLDYSVICDAWTNTMPNRGILRELLQKTKGRLMIMNEEGIHYDFRGKIKLSEKIREYRENMSSREQKSFNSAFQRTELYLQYTLEL